MKTKLTASPEEAARFLLRDELVAFPTETVYGLGANIFSEKAVGKIFEVKGRPSDNPLIAHISDFSELLLLVKRITAPAEKLIDTFFPGPLTIVLPKSKYVPSVVAAGLETIGVRMPSHPVAHKFLKACGVSVAAPSANLSGKPSPTTWQAAKEDLDGKISCILKGDQSDVGLESTIVDCTGKTPLLLRAGAITLEQLQEVVPGIEVYSPAPDARPKSPGQKYRHYAPNASIILVDHPSEIESSQFAAYIGIENSVSANKVKISNICPTVTEYARSLFDFFRYCDAHQIKIIYCQRVASTGLGLALMDRISRAAQH